MLSIPTREHNPQWTWTRGSVTQTSYSQAPNATGHGAELAVRTVRRGTVFRNYLKQIEKAYLYTNKHTFLGRGLEYDTARYGQKAFWDYFKRYYTCHIILWLMKVRNKSSKLYFLLKHYKKNNDVMTEFVPSIIFTILLHQENFVKIFIHLWLIMQLHSI